MQRVLRLRSSPSIPVIPCPGLIRNFCHSRYASHVSSISPQRSPVGSRTRNSVFDSNRHYTTTDVRNAGRVRPPQRGRAAPAARVAQGRPVGRPVRSTPSVQPPQLSKEETARELETLTKDLILPTIQDLPHMPQDLFTNPSYTIHSHIKHLRGFRESTSVSSTEYSHKISFKDDRLGDLTIVGRAQAKRNAMVFAYLKLLAQVHAEGKASMIVPIPGSTIERERHAMLDVYLFAARYQDIPQIEVRKTGGRHMLSYETQVSLPLLGLTVIGRGKTEQSSEVSAALEARKALEKYITGEDSIKPIAEDQVFGMASGVAFCNWYKYERKGTWIDVRVQNYKTKGIVAKVVLTDGTTKIEREFPGVRAGSKKAAEDLAQLVAAITLTRETPEMQPRFFTEFRLNNFQVLPPVNPVLLEMTTDTEEALNATLRHSHAALQQLEGDEDGSNQERSGSTIYRPLSRLSYDKKCKELSRRKDAYESRDDLEKLRGTRADYPMNQYAENVLKVVKGNTYSIIIGATGSGKSTQVPQILLNDAVQRGEGASCNIICTQPRRIAAKSVAHRVADERAEFVGDCVGYHVRGDLQLPSYGGSINFCTTGILGAQLQHHADDIMENASHLIIDEVHERDTIIDFLLTNVRRLIRDRLAAGKKVPHVILMSATIDPEQFANYLEIETPTGDIIECPSLSVPGRTFPVRELYLNDVMKQLAGAGSKALMEPNTAKFIASEQTFSTSHKHTRGTAKEEEDLRTINWAAERQRGTAKSPTSMEEQEQAMVPHALVAATIAHIAKTTQEGAILTFLPGLEDITKVDELLRLQPEQGVNFTDATKYRTFMLHSSIQDAQKEVFNPVPAGCRKIILATNIAETSITIPDVQHVVDTGKLRELQYDQARRITKLACVWVSKSNAKQRAGRAGRVQDGNYYGLYTRERYASLRAVGLPELLRSDLQEVCLGIKDQGYSAPIREFLSEAIEPPSMDAVDAAIENLVQTQALTEDESLTALGKLLAQLPVHPSLGKMIVLGIVFRCLDPMLIIGASYSERNIFFSPPGARAQAQEKKHGFARTTLSDHIGLLTAVKELRMLSEVRGPRAMGDYASRNYLHIGAFRGILNTAEQIEGLLHENRVITRTSRLDRLHFQFGDPELNENSDKVGLIKLLIMAGFNPNLGVRRGRLMYRTPQQANAMIHPSSISGSRAKDMKGKVHAPVDPKTELVSFSELVRSSDGNSMYLRDTTPVTPLMAALFSGKLEQQDGKNILRMDGWLPLYVRRAHQIRSILRLQQMVQGVTTSAFKDLAARRLLADHKDRNTFADALVQLLDHDLAYNATMARKSADRPLKLNPAAAFAPARKDVANPRSLAGRLTDPQRQQVWDDLVSSWGKGSPASSTTARGGSARSMTF